MLKQELAQLRAGSNGSAAPAAVDNGKQQLNAKIKVFSCREERQRLPILRLCYHRLRRVRQVLAFNCDGSPAMPDCLACLGSKTSQRLLLFSHDFMSLTLSEQYV